LKIIRSHNSCLFHHLPIGANRAELVLQFLAQGIERRRESAECKPDCEIAPGAIRQSDVSGARQELPAAKYVILQQHVCEKRERHNFDQFSSCLLASVK
jgi:hypothetical protein